MSWRAAAYLVSLVPALAVAQVAAPAPPGGMTLTCQFNAGPRAGQMRDLSGLPGMAPFAIGGACSDGAGSTGIGVSPSVAPGAMPGAPLPENMTLTCRFSAGPRAGQVERFGSASAVPPFPVGGACSDGRGSTGLGVSDARGQGRQYRRRAWTPGRRSAYGAAGFARENGMAGTVIDNAAKQRFELEVEGHTAFIAYRRDGETVDMLHTEVPKELGGRGIGAVLAQGALDMVGAAGGKVVATCPFIARYIDKNAKYKALVA